MSTKSWAAWFGPFAALLLIASVAGAQSFSDLDVTGLERLEGGRDVSTHVNPFASGVTTAENLAVENLQLAGIVFSNEKDAYALISGYLVRPGDMIAGFRVDDIERDRVRLRRLDQVIVLALGGGI